jgi:signal peptidase I
VTRRSAVGCLFEIVETLVLTVVIFLGLQTFVAQPYKVDGSSMERTLMQDQYVLVDKLSPRWAPYARGEIVVFDPPPGLEAGPNPSPFIKRVIGLPGDRIELRDGAVFVNGTRLDEPYAYAHGGVTQPTAARAGVSQWLVPSGQLFVMGDHREVSEDSRVFGPIDTSRVIGRAWLRYWPISSFGILQTPPSTPG